MKKLKRKLELNYLWFLFCVFIIFSYDSFIYCMPSANLTGIPEVGGPLETNSNQNLSQANTPSSQELDTISISSEKTGEQGNWVKKKNWLIKSYETNNNIYNIALQIEQTKKIYKEKYHSIDNELDTFYKNIGIEQGKLQEMFDSVERYIEKKKRKDILEMTSKTEKLNASEKELQKKMEVLESQVSQIKDELKQLGLNMEAIADVDKSLTTRLQKVDEQITLAMTNAETAKTKVESMWDIIDDKKARDIYYEVLNIESTLKSILDYLQNILAKDFDTVIQTTKTQIANASSGIKTLESKGLIIKDRSRRVDQLKVAELQKLDQEAIKQQKESSADIITTPKPQKLGIFERIYNFIITSFAKTYIFITNLFSKQVKNTKENSKQYIASKIDLAQVTKEKSENKNPTMPTNFPTMPAAEPLQPSMPNAQ